MPSAPAGAFLRMSVPASGVCLCLVSSEDFINRLSTKALLLHGARHQLEATEWHPSRRVTCREGPAKPRLLSPEEGAPFNAADPRF